MKIGPTASLGDTSIWTNPTLQATFSNPPLPRQKDRDQVNDLDIDDDNGTVDVEDPSIIEPENDLPDEDIEREDPDSMEPTRRLPPDPLR